MDMQFHVRNVTSWKRVNFQQEWEALFVTSRCALNVRLVIRMFMAGNLDKTVSNVIQQFHFMLKLLIIPKLVSRLMLLMHPLHVRNVMVKMQQLALSNTNHCKQIVRRVIGIPTSDNSRKKNVNNAILRKAFVWIM